MEAPTTEELLRKIQELEAGHANLREEMSQLMFSGGTLHSRAHSVSPERPRLPAPIPVPPYRRRDSESRKGSPSRFQRESRCFDDPTLPPQMGRVGGGFTELRKLSERQCLNIIQSMGQSVHIYDNENRILYWNRSAENLFGYSAAEALGKNAYDLLVDRQYYDSADIILNRVRMGESWTGQFPVRDKKGHNLLIFVTNAPFYDDDGTLIGVITVSTDSKVFKGMKISISETKELEYCQESNKPKNSVLTRLGLDTEQPLQTAIALKITNLASRVSDKVRSKIKTGDNNVVKEGGGGDSPLPDHGFSDATFFEHEDRNSTGNSTPRGEPGGLAHGVFTKFAVVMTPVKKHKDSNDESEGKTAIHRLTSKAEAWIGKKAMHWSRKGNEQGTSESQDSEHPQSVMKSGCQIGDLNHPVANEASGSWSSFNLSSTNSASSFGSGSSSSVNRMDVDSDYLDYEIMWEDLTIGEQVGQGSCGTVYHGLWYGSDVAVKVFSKQEYSDDAIHSFRQEVCLMKGLRHPNILLFMGAVTSPQRLCIVTEFLPRFILQLCY